MLAFGWARCRRVRLALWDYASERLSEGAMERVEQHLQQCAACGQELTSLKRAQGLLSACRAQEEPAPRSDWSDLRQRIVADGIAPLAGPSLSRTAPLSRRASRAPWSMQLMASMAGGFAAMMLVAVSYHALHLSGSNSTPLSNVPAPTVAATAPGITLPGSKVTSPVIVTAAEPVAQEAASLDGKNGFQITTGMVSILYNMRVDPAPVVTTSASGAAGTTRTALKREPREARSLQQSSVIAAVKSHNIRRVEKSRFVSSSHSTSRPENRASDTQQIASLEHVQPINGDGEDVSGYVVGSVLPVSHEDDHDY